MSDIGESFLEGLNEGLKPWAEQQARHKYAKNERLAIAAFNKAKNAKIIEGSASLLADRFAGTEEQGESWNAVKNSLIKYANNNPNLLTNIRKDIAKGGGRYTFGDKAPEGSINIIGKLYRSAGLSQTEKTLRRRHSDASDAWHVIHEWTQRNPKGKKPPELSIMRQHELSKMNIEGRPTSSQIKKATSNAMRKLSSYKLYLTDNHKALLAEGTLSKDLAGNTIRGMGGTEIYDILRGGGSEGTALNAAIPMEAAEARDRSNFSTLWGLIGSDDAAPSLTDLTLTKDQESSVSSMLQQIRELTTSPSLRQRRQAIDAYLNQELNTLPNDRREEVRKLLEAAFK